MKPTFIFLALAASITLAGCAQYATVSQKSPQFHARAAPRSVRSCRWSRASPARCAQEKREPLAALGEYLTAAETAAKQLARNPGDTAARDDYNFAVARVLGTIQEAKLDPWTQPLRVPAAGGEFVLTHKPDPRPQWNPALYDFMPADQFDIRGTYVTHARAQGRPRRAARRDRAREERGRREGLHDAEHVYYGVTALVRFEGRRAVLAFEDPLATERVSFGGRSFPLAADFTVPLAVMLASTNPKKLELTRLLRPEKYAETARIARLQPYDPNKTVVLVIHGLMDSPATWTPMINAPARRRADSAQLPILVLQLSERLPVSVFRGDPAARTRRSREAFPAAQEDGRHRPQHGRLHQPAAHHRHAATSSGWRCFKKPPEQVPLSAESQETRHRGADFPAPAGSRARDLHLRAAARQRPREQLARPHRLEPRESAVTLLNVGERRAEVGDVPGRAI